MLGEADEKQSTFSEFLRFGRAFFEEKISHEILDSTKRALIHYNSILTKNSLVKFSDVYIS